MVMKDCKGQLLSIWLEVLRFSVSQSVDGMAWLVINWQISLEVLSFSVRLAVK